MQVRIFDPQSPVCQSYASVRHGGRLCVAVPSGRAFAITVMSDLTSDNRANFETRRRFEYVVSVDGRDTLTNQDARRDAEGLITGRSYICRGFRTSASGVHEFVCAELGANATTGERNGTGSCAGLVGVAVYADALEPKYEFPVARPKIYRGGDQPATLNILRASATRGGVSTSLRGGPTAGAAAGAFISDAVGQTTWKRGELVAEEVVEYDTPEGWAARGVVFDAPVLDRSPWPGDAPRARFADPSTL